MIEYLLRGTVHVGGSDFIGAGREFKTQEFTIWAKDDGEAEETRKRDFGHVTSHALFRRIG